MSDLDQGGPERQFRERLSQGRFEIQRCAGCAKHVFYPRVVCPYCGHHRLDWVAASGAGTVYSTTVVRRRPADGGDYNVALIDLAEGPRMMSRVVGLPPVAVKIGMQVSARIARMGESTLVEFVAR